MINPLSIPETALETYRTMNDDQQANVDKNRLKFLVSSFSLLTCMDAAEYLEKTDYEAVPLVFAGIATLYATFKGVGIYRELRTQYQQLETNNEES